MNPEQNKERERCTCNWLHDAASDPKMPISFNSETNEFQLHGSDRSIRMIYYCPYCGGRVPESLRDSFFAIVSAEEKRRLDEMAARVTSREEAIRLLGPPDEERHALLYRNLSKTADVIAYIYNDKWKGLNRLRKYIGPKSPSNDIRNA